MRHRYFITKKRDGYLVKKLFFNLLYIPIAKTKDKHKAKDLIYTKLSRI